MQTDALSVEVDRNYDFFQRNLTTFLKDHEGQYALLRHREVLGFYDEPGEAAAVATRQFEDDLFSIQEVTSLPIDLGLYTFAAR